MAVSVGILNHHCAVLHFVCPPNDHEIVCGGYETSCSAWYVPLSAAWPLVYFILGNSIAAYWLITWANQHARAGYVLAYTALQPFSSTLLTVCLIILGVQGLELPGWNALGGLGIILGLFLIAPRLLTGAVQWPLRCRTAEINTRRTSSAALSRRSSARERAVGMTRLGGQVDSTGFLTEDEHSYHGV